MIWPSESGAGQGKSTARHDRTAGQEHGAQSECRNIKAGEHSVQAQGGPIQPPRPHCVSMTALQQPCPQYDLPLSSFSDT
jgi:hypothetical protein